MSSGRFAQRGEGRPDFGRENFPAWHHQDRGSFGPLAMGPRMGDGRDFRGPGRGDFDPREFRNEMIARRLQEGEMRPPMPPAPGRERPDFRSQERPNFGPSEGDRGRGELRRPDDRGRDFGPRPPRGYRDYLPDGPPLRREIQ
jgi:hypothetical protein